VLLTTSAAALPAFNAAFAPPDEELAARFLSISFDAGAARRSYREGIEAAARKGDLHAKGEIEAALDMLGE